MRWSIMAGILLSTIGLLCLSLPRKPHALPVSKAAGRISLGLLIGDVCSAAFRRYLPSPGIPKARYVSTIHP